MDISALVVSEMLLGSRNLRKELIHMPYVRFSCYIYVNTCMSLSSNGSTVLGFPRRVLQFFIGLWNTTYVRIGSKTCLGDNKQRYRDFEPASYVSL